MINNNSQAVLKGTFILAASGMIVKTVGALNWILLSRILGGEGIGLYQMGFPVYLMGLTLSSAGLPVAVSILTAGKLAQDDYIGARQVFRVASRLLFFTGLFFAAAILLGARWLLAFSFIRDGRAYWSIIALAPAVFIVTYMSGLRGYLQGWQKMAPTAWSEIVEQLARVLVMLLLAWLLLPYGLEYGAAGASVGAGAGGVLALLVLFWHLRRLNEREKDRFSSQKYYADERDAALLGRLLRLAMPIALSSLMLPVVASLDLLIVPGRLEQAGFTTQKATTLFGYLTGMAVPLVNLATILTAALAVALVPAVAGARAAGEKGVVREKAGTAFRIASAVTIPASVAVYILAESLASIVYNSPEATPVIKITSAAIFFLGLHQVSTGVLQGLGFTHIPVVSMIMAAALKVLLNWRLVARPDLGIIGAGYATIADMAFAAFINMYFIWRHTGYRMSLKRLARVAAAALIMGAVLIFTLSFSGRVGGWSLLLSVAAGLAVYPPLMLFMGGLPLDDIDQIPFFGGLLARRLRNLRAG